MLSSESFIYKLYHYVVIKTMGDFNKMCLACSISEGNPNAKNEKQIDYSSNEEYNSSTY